jgi:hypothetical protein
VLLCLLSLAYMQLTTPTTEFNKHIMNTPVWILALPGVLAVGVCVCTVMSFLRTIKAEPLPRRWLAIILLVPLLGPSAYWIRCMRKANKGDITDFTGRHE